MGDIRSFILVTEGEGRRTFKGRSPRQAALKAATRGIKDIQLREVRKNADGTKSVHVFEGSIEMIDKGDKAPEWLPDKIKKPIVKKLRVDHV